MNILFVSAVLPYPLYSGGQVRMYNLLKRLSKKHSITLFSFIRTNEERTYAKNFDFLPSVKMVYRGRALQSKYLLKAFGAYPLLLASYDNEEMRRLIQNEISNHDYNLIHIEPFYVFPSIPVNSLPLVVSEHNIEYLVYENFAKSYSISSLRPVVYADSQKIRRWEERVWKKAVSVTAVSNDDSQVITRTTGTSCSVIPNGVDTEWFRFNVRKFNPKNPTFLFVGNFAWAPNIEAVRTLLKDIWPKVTNEYPAGVLTIVGKQFPKALRAMVSGNIFVREDVEDIRDVFLTSDILLAPMGIGGGSKFKLLEAMASGTPVITTAQGRMGIEALPGKHVWEAETAEQFVQSIQSIYSNQNMKKTIIRNARKLVEEKYDWSVIADRLDYVWRKSV